MSGTTDIPRHPSKHPTACLLPLTRTCLSSLPLVLPEMFGQPVQCKSALEMATRTVTSDVHLVDLLRHVLIIVLVDAWDELLNRPCVMLFVVADKNKRSGDKPAWMY